MIVPMGTLDANIAAESVKALRTVFNVANMKCTAHAHIVGLRYMVVKLVCHWVAS